MTGGDADQVLEFDGSFGGDELDRSQWLPWYLPQWSSRAASAARYDIHDGRLLLRIDVDQAPWCPEWDGDLRVSSLQTALPAASLGSRVGQHARFHPNAIVREGQAETLLYTPRFGRIEMRARASADPRCMVALWMIGLEDTPEHSGELCVAEIFGRTVSPGRARVGMGIHRFGDPALVEDFQAVAVDFDVTEPHTYAADWRPDGVDFTIDGRPIRSTRTAPDYPMQLMLGLYEFPADDDSERPASGYPKVCTVEYVRGYRRDRA